MHIYLSISFTNTHKHLGVTFQSSGKWDVHIDEMISKTRKMIGVLPKIKFVLSRRCLNTMCIYCIRPVLEYACVFPSSYPQPPNLCTEAVIDRAMITWILGH